MSAGDVATSGGIKLVSDLRGEVIWMVLDDCPERIGFTVKRVQLLIGIYLQSLGGIGNPAVVDRIYWVAGGVLLGALETQIFWSGNLMETRKLIGVTGLQNSGTSLETLRTPWYNYRVSFFPLFQEEYTYLQ